MSVLRGMEQLVIVFIEVGEGLSCRGGETFHMPFNGSRIPCNIILRFFRYMYFFLAENSNTVIIA